MKYDGDIKDFSNLKKVAGFGTMLYKFTAINVDLLHIPTLSYHLPLGDIWLFSSQAHQLYCGSSKLDGDMVLMHPKQQAGMSI